MNTSFYHTPRTSGVLLHPTSLPGPYGIGDLGPEAYRFVDFLAQAKQSWWQMLPIGPTGFGNSPYNSFSAFAGNIYLISPDLLEKDNLLSKRDLAPLRQKNSSHHVNFEFVSRLKESVLRIAFRHFQTSPQRRLTNELVRFKKKNSSWLANYTLFCALKRYHEGRPWPMWDAGFRSRDKSALKKAEHLLHSEISFHEFVQFIFDRQWKFLHAYSRKKNVRLLGDIPIFVALDSADVWAHQELFTLKPNGSPSLMAGVPPDYFSKDGQLWGNPLYRWDRLKKTHYEWWIRRFEKSAERFDAIRIDHFIGFQRAWAIKGGAKTARRGKWLKGPRDHFFKTVRKKLPALDIIAEDLGVLTPEAAALRDRFAFPGMRVLQFAFGNTKESTVNMPLHYPENCIVYTGTHDNNTTRGWLGENANKESTRSKKQIKNEMAFITSYLRENGFPSNHKHIHWGLIELAFASPARTAIVPMQDWLGLGAATRMNTPGSNSGNWEWRMDKQFSRRALIKKCKDLTRRYERLP